VSVEHPERCQIDTESSVSPTPNNINNNINNNISAKRFVKPTVEEVRAYSKERNNNVDAEKFISHYDSNGWKVGKTPMKDWKGAVRTWEKNDYGYHNKTVSEEPPKPQFNFIKAEGYEGAPTMCPRCNTRFIRNGGMVICNNCHIWYEKEDGLWKMYKRGS
jgi:hypothetical protein